MAGVFFDPFTGEPTIATGLTQSVDAGLPAGISETGASSLFGDAGAGLGGILGTAAIPLGILSAINFFSGLTNANNYTENMQNAYLRSFGPQFAPLYNQPSINDFFPNMPQTPNTARGAMFNGANLRPGFLSQGLQGQVGNYSKFFTPQVIQNAVSQAAKEQGLFNTASAAAKQLLPSQFQITGSSPFANFKGTNFGSNPFLQQALTQYFGGNPNGFGAAVNAATKPVNPTDVSNLVNQVHGLPNFSAMLGPLNAPNSGLTGLPQTSLSPLGKTPSPLGTPGAQTPQVPTFSTPFTNNVGIKGATGGGLFSNPAVNAGQNGLFSPNLNTGPSLSNPTLTTPTQPNPGAVNTNVNSPQLQSSLNPAGNMGFQTSFNPKSNIISINPGSTGSQTDALTGKPLGDQNLIGDFTQGKTPAPASPQNVVKPPSVNTLAQQTPAPISAPTPQAPQLPQYSFDRLGFSKSSFVQPNGNLFGTSQPILGPQPTAFDLSGGFGTPPAATSTSIGQAAGGAAQATKGGFSAFMKAHPILTKIGGLALAGSLLGVMGKSQQGPGGPFSFNSPFGSFSMNNGQANFNPNLSGANQQGLALAQQQRNNLLQNLKAPTLQGILGTPVYQAALQGLLQPLEQQKATDLKNLNDQLAADNLTGGSYDAYQHFLLNQNYGNQENAARNNAILTALQAGNQQFNNGLQLLGTSQDVNNSILSPYFDLLNAGLNANQLYNTQQYYQNMYLPQLLSGIAAPLALSLKGSSAL